MRGCHEKDIYPRNAVRDRLAGDSCNSAYRCHNSKSEVIA